MRRLLPACLLSLCAATASADTLREIYELALKNNAQLKAQEARYRADKEALSLGRAGLLPQVNVSYDDTDSKTETESNTFNRELIIIPVATEVDVDREGYQLSLRQAIFDLPAWFTFRAGKKTSQQARAAFAAQQQLFIVGTVQAYLGVLRAQNNLAAAGARERAFRRQLKQIRQRFEVGLIAITDVHEARAAHDLARVERITEENQLNVALEQLEVLTGRAHANLQLLAEDFAIEAPMPAERSKWVDFALANNFQLAAARHGEAAARQTARAHITQHFPKVSGSISYSDYETAGTLTQSSSTLNPPPDQNQKQEVYAIQVELPLFAGGSIGANRRRAAQQYIAAREERIQLMRTTVSDTRSLHMSVLSDVARVAARRQSIVSSQSALDATRAGYEAGTRNVVDVLNAQNGLFGARRDYANARYEYVGNMLRLKQQAGLLSPEDVYQLDSELVAPPPPTANGGATPPQPPQPPQP